MVTTTDITFLDKRSIRKQSRQQGVLSNYPIDNRPLAAKLRLYERMARTDTTLRSAMHTMIDSVVASFGMPQHPDPEIADFLQYNLLSMQDATGQDWRDLLVAAEFTKTWAGFSVSECIYNLNFGQMYLDTLLTYHPMGIILRPNAKGRLIEGQKSKVPGKTSGIYQTSNDGIGEEHRLSMWKVLYTARESEFGRHYGRSTVSPAYKAYRLKEAFTDILVASLGKIGERMLWVRSQSYQTGETRVNPATGKEEPISSIQLIKQQFEAAEGIPSLLILPYQQADLKPEVGSVPLTDQVLGDFILKCIDFANIEMVREFVPYFLIDDKGSNINAVQTEKRMEVYLSAINRKRMALARPFCTNALHPLVTWNFNRESAKIRPTLGTVHSERAQDWVATMQMVKGLTDQGYLNPTNSTDWDIVRQMVRIAERTQDPQDLEFIKQVLLNPRNRAASNPITDDGDPALGERDPNLGKLPTDIKDSEGIAANGQGTQGTGMRGRPTGSVTPLFNPRPVKRSRA